MASIVRVNIGDETSILVETMPIVIEGEEFEPGISTTGAWERATEKIIDLPQSTIDKMSKALVAFSKQLLEELAREFGEQEGVAFTVEYGVNLVGNLDVQIASASTASTMRVTVSWTS